MENRTDMIKKLYEWFCLKAKGIKRSKKEFTFQSCKKATDLVFIRSMAYNQQITGIEPASSAWEADILPMNYICESPAGACSSGKI